MLISSSVPIPKGTIGRRKMLANSDYVNPASKPSGFKAVERRLKKTMPFMTFYCEGIIYSSINDIPSNNKEVAAYYKKVRNMKFSKGTYLNVKRAEFYAKVCYAFDCHLDNVDASYIACKGYNKETGNPFEAQMKIEYRTSERYKKRNVARSYALIAALEQSSDEYKDVTLVTFTTFQKDGNGNGLDYLIQNAKLIEATAKIHDVIRKDYPKVPYVHVIESHKTGYIHVHRVYGCNITPEHQEKYRRLWASYDAGSYDKGLDFKYNEFSKVLPEEKEGQRTYTNDYDGALRYIIKYIYKSISAEGSAPFHQHLSDACIWYVSKRTNRHHKGIRSFYISPVWNDLIKDDFKKKESQCHWESVILTFCGTNTELIKPTTTTYTPEVLDLQNELMEFCKDLEELMDTSEADTILSCYPLDCATYAYVSESDFEV